ncbi:MAG: ABC transporter permease subunit [Candidatus Brocadiaceae bacterium]
MKSLKRRRLTDKAAHWIITLGGAATVFVILAIFLFIFLEVYPLFRGAQVLQENTRSLNGTVVSIGADEHQEVAYAIYADGNIDFISLSDGSILKKYSIAALNGAAITEQSPTKISPHSASLQEENGEGVKTSLPKTTLQHNTITSVYNDNNRFVLGTNQGKFLSVSITFAESFDKGKRTIVPEIFEDDTLLADDGKKALRLIASRKDDNTTVTVAYTEDGRLFLISSETEKTLFGSGEKKELKKNITELITGQKKNTTLAFDSLTINSPGLQNEGEITSMVVDHFMENLYAGTSLGDILHINIKDRENPFLVEKVQVSNEAVTALGFLLGDVSLVVGDHGGGVNIWMQVREEGSLTGWALKKIHTLESHHASILAIASSLRDKCFITASSDGTVHLNHATSERTLLTLETKYVPTALAFTPKANGIFVADSKSALFQWVISNPHPEITFKTLFGSVWYEGYEKPEFVWQSTGGTDDFEPKLSLIPLIFGTIKGTIYAMFIAVPIGIFGALYTSQFLHNSFKIIKPVIELMAALPSVILGFLAGLWLAPLMERIFPAIIIMPFFITLSIVIALLIWKFLPVFWKGRYKHGAEALFLIPFIIAAIFTSIQLGGVFESFILGGDYRECFSNILGLKYDQRNALVVGFAMGFAVIPLIFTISEDAVSNVPNSLVSASLALGATPWQTAVRVVLPTASPGIFSAVMIGFGRAIGETMIVLMATGNTPIMDWNLFNGFRALSANIAVEIPEAPFGGTLYRVLFLAALLLFVTTFIVNTFAEMVRQRMRRRYGKL